MNFIIFFQSFHLWLRIFLMQTLITFDIEQDVATRWKFSCRIIHHANVWLRVQILKYVESVIKNEELKMPPSAVMKHYYIKLCSKIVFVISSTRSEVDEYLHNSLGGRDCQPAMWKTEKNIMESYDTKFRHVVPKITFWAYYKRIDTNDFLRRCKFNVISREI